MTTFFFFLALLTFFLLYNSRRKPYPPGPKGWPIIGNMLMMDKLTHRGLAKIACQYGGLVHLRMGFLHMVTVSTPDMAQEVLQIQDNNFANRPVTMNISYLTYNRADMAFANYGPFWRQMRKISVMKLFSRKRAESWDSVREEVDEMVRYVVSNAGLSVNIGELVFGLTRNIIYRAAFGSISRTGQDEFIKIMQEFSKLFGAFNICDFVPGLAWLDPQGFKGRLVKARDSLDKFIDSILDEHIANKKCIINDKGNNSDMVYELLAFYSDDLSKINHSDDVNDSLKLTRDNIKAIIMDVMFGGTETVASAIEWTIEVDTDDVFGLTAPRATRLVAVPTPRLLCPIC
ncbi:Ferulate-5-hydroxylase [Heracleum sosnowskyi]|uniref:Ferulate-5-hydroxylase n=1 Tax=Heracleum sosnowskyi TaxID=360622 RepID=A0AAD8H566_9APIA|nr:Ferulate-5-hydroxylase [Heracleum sosnowskyi]